MDSDSGFEFDESDIYNSGCATTSANSLEFGRSLHGSYLAKKPSSSEGRIGAPASLPLNVPDWSKILGKEYRWRNKSMEEEEEGCDVDERGGRLPPHEFLAKTRSGYV